MFAYVWGVGAIGDARACVPMFDPGLRWPVVLACVLVGTAYALQ